MARLFVTLILNKILWCYHSNETSSKGQNVSIDLFSNFLKFYWKKFESFFEFLWPLLRVKSKAGFYMSWKSQTFREFTVSRKLCRLMKSRDDRYPPSSGMVEDKSGQTHLRFVWRPVYLPGIWEVKFVVLGCHGLLGNYYFCLVPTV